LLDVSRIVTGQLRLSVRSFQLIPIVEAAIEVVRPAADAKSIRIETAFDPTAGPIAGDPDRMQQILWNLLSNAVKFTPRGGDIKVRMQRVGSHLEIVVSDTGKGIAPKLLPFIFERFRQGDSSTTREHGGLGLGLAIVRHLVELHGGVVSARSEGEDRGAEFTIQLPILARPKELGGAVTRHHVNEYGPGGTSLAGLRILLVDDEPDAREIVATILGEAGAEIATASNSRQALELIEQWSPDLLISDIGMPGESGYDLIRKVRALSNGNSGQIPAIALTAYARVEDRLKILSAGFQMHVPKPIEPIELATVVASLTKRL
jgi:CheY-like chemotaxis protein